MDLPEKSPGDLWEMIGSLEELEVMPVLTNLFAIYEQRLNNDPENREVQLFFRHLAQVLEQVAECNLNRR